MTYVSGSMNAPHVYFTESTSGAATWIAPKAIESSGDRGYYTAPAISPNGARWSAQIRVHGAQGDDAHQGGVRRREDLCGSE